MFMEVIDIDHSEDESFSDYEDSSDDDEYQCMPSPPHEQHARLVALRQLTSLGIPCILWGDDALIFAHLANIRLYHQQILVPDDQLDDAVSVLGQLKYTRVPMIKAYLQTIDQGHSIFPKGVCLQYAQMPENDPHMFDVTPRFILLLPQSYFGLDVCTIERFQKLVPPLDSSNKDILVPKFNTFLEACVEFIMNPPGGLHLWIAKCYQDLTIFSLLESRTQTHLAGELGCLRLNYRLSTS